jgi:heme exporter protein D
MTPAFASWPAFFAMGGYALYVWLAAAAAVVSLAALTLHTVWRRRSLLAAIRRRQGRLERIRRARSISRRPPSELAP